MRHRNLSALLLAWIFVASSEAAANASSWYVVKDSNNENIHYFKDENESYSSDSWAKAQTPETLPRLLSSDNLADGDMVYILGGTYSLDNTIALAKSVSVYGSFSGNEQSIDDRANSNTPTILSGQNSRQVLSLTANATLDGLTITQGKSGYGGGIRIVGPSSAVLTNCSITHNSASNNGGGLYISGKSTPVLTNCTITNNSAGSGGGIFINGSTAVLNLTNSTVTANSANTSGGGIYLQSLSTINILNCTIAHNLKAAEGLELYCNYSTANITNSIVWNQNTDNAIARISYGTVRYTNCATPSTLETWDNPQTSALTVNGVTHSFYPLDANPDLQTLIAAGTSSEAPQTDQLGVTRRLPPSIGSVEGPATYYVANSDTGILYLKAYGDYNAALWSEVSQASSLPAFLKASVSGDTVYVGAGTYSLSETLELGRNVKLLGSDSSSILDGNSNSAIMNITSDSQIDGLTLKNAKDSALSISASPTITNCAVYASNGKGVLVSSGSPKFTNFTVSSSSAEGLLISSGSPSFTNCTVTANSVGVSCSGNSSFMNCSIVGNGNNSFGASSLTNSLVYGTSSGTGNFVNCALPEGFTGENSVYIAEWTPVSSSQAVKGVTHAVFALNDNSALDALSGAGTADGVPATDILGASRLTPPTIGSLEYPYDSSYVVSIPESLDIANSGWNSVAGGITATHDSSSTGRTFTPVKKLRISASSANGWKLKSEHDQTVGYTLKGNENGEALTSWEFSSDEISAATAKTVGAYVEDYSAKPAGEYSDTLTFDISVEDK